jgi:hypothetical protein
MNQFRLWYIYTWKCHKKSPCVAILNKQKCGFFFIYKIKGEQNRSCLVGWYQWERKGGGEKVWEYEYGANTVYTCLQMEKWDLLILFQEWGKEG